MATYKGIQGYAVKKLSSDPTASTAVGQLWYNSSTGKFKIATAGAAAWASAAAMNTGRYACTGTGTQTAAFVAGGYGPPGGPTATNEQYDGTTWTELGNLVTIRGETANAGTPGAGLAFGGDTPSGQDTETWNGSSWTTSPATLNTGRAYLGRAGTATAALAIGGYEGGPYKTETEEFNGSVWAEKGDLNTATNTIMCGGINTSAFAAGGRAGPAPTAVSQTFDGTSWTVGNSINTARRYGGGNGAPGAPSGIIFGGTTSGAAAAVANTETFDGTSWTEQADLAVAVGGTVGGGGSNTSALAFGGLNASSAATNAVEEWNDPVYTNKTVTVS